MLSKTKFVEKIKGYLKEIDAFKTVNPDDWKDTYDIIILSLNNILDLAKGNLLEAEDEFSRIPVSKFDTFRDYVFSTDSDVMKKESGTTQRYKSSRARRKKTYMCPTCGLDMTLDDDTFRCPGCNNTIEIRGSSSVLNISREDQKHTEKLLYTISGRGDPPKAISKIC